jgi:hypothetical protein
MAVRISVFLFAALLLAAPVQGYSPATGSFGFFTVITIVGVLFCATSMFCVVICVILKFCKVSVEGSARDTRNAPSGRRTLTQTCGHRITRPRGASRNHQTGSFPSSGEDVHTTAEPLSDLPSYVVVMKNLNAFEEVAPQSLSVTDGSLPTYPSNHQLPAYTDGLPSYFSGGIEQQLPLTTGSSLVSQVCANHPEEDSGIQDGENSHHRLSLCESPTPSPSPTVCPTEDSSLQIDENHQPLRDTAGDIPVDTVDLPLPSAEDPPPYETHLLSSTDDYNSAPAECT